MLKFNIIKLLIFFIKNKYIIFLFLKFLLYLFNHTI
uniref:Uncharacterized protein n=1 Tax=Cyanophora sudae TaxID=1522369 RepID=A0A2Z4HG28_9EUKA|nr:hypothetical protein [Cyanophora sudae]AWW13749.1 hypothetical protein [Cyanophora sudae]